MVYMTKEMTTMVSFNYQCDLRETGSCSFSTSCLPLYLDIGT